MNSLASSSLKVPPHGFSRRTTFAPLRFAISVIRSQKNPLAKTAHFTPGSTKLETAASIPPLPVPETASVTPCSAPKTIFNRRCTSSITLKKNGSRWLTIGLAKASYTRGCTWVGPGPNRNRLGGCNGENFCALMLSVVVAILPFPGSAWYASLKRCSTSTGRSALSLVTRLAANLSILRFGPPYGQIVETANPDMTTRGAHPPTKSPLPPSPATLLPRLDFACALH